MVAGRLPSSAVGRPSEGDKRSKVEVVADEIGPSLRWATAQITKNERRARSDGPPARGRKYRPMPVTSTSTTRPQQWRRLRIR